MSNIEMGSYAFGYEIFDRILKADRERESFGLFRRTVCYVPQHELQARKRRMVMKDRVLRIGWGGSSQKVIFAICALVFAVCVALPFSADAADKLVVKNGDNKVFVVTDTGQVAIGTDAPGQDVDIVAPDNGLIRLSSSVNDNTTKASRLLLRHYSNAQLPVYLFGAASTPTNNFVAFGGGSTLGNAATQIDLYTASNPTTAMGTSRVSITSDGNVTVSNLAGSYSGGSAYVCVNNSGRLYTSETGCP
jgi:hypothetical protein